MADAEAQAAIVAADVAVDAADAVMAPRAAAQLDLDLARLEVDLVVDHDYLGFGFELIETHRFADRAAGFVHVGLGFQRQHLAALDPALGDAAGKARAPGPEAIAADDLVHRHEADVVAVVGMARARVAQADEQQHGELIPRSVVKDS